MSRTMAVNIFTVANSADQSELVAVASELAGYISNLTGFIDQEITRSSDGKRVVVITHWQTPADHYACFESKEQPPVGQRMIELIQSGRVEMHLDLYETVKVTKVPVN